MPLERFFKLPIDKRTLLLETAARQFAERGFEGASLNEILAQAGLSKGSYYYYFEDKEDLYAATVVDAFERMMARLPSLALEGASRETFWQELDALSAIMVEAALAVPELTRLFLSMTEELRRSPRLQPIFARTHDMFRTLIEAGQRVGCVRTDLPMDVLVTLLATMDAALDGMLVARRPALTGEELTAHGRLVFDTYKRLLIAEGTP